MTTLTFDIETIALPAELREASRPTAETVKYGNTKDPGKRAAMVDAAVAAWERGDKAALDPTQGQVCCIGWQASDVAACHMHLDPARGFHPDSEILCNFWDIVAAVYHMDRGNFRLVGHNIAGFDLPYLVRRSWILGVTVPVFILSEMNGYRSAMIVDTMRLWGFGDRNEFITLDKLATLLGIPTQEGGVDGAGVGEAWASGEAGQQQVVAHCLSDVRITGAIYERLTGGGE